MSFHNYKRAAKRMARARDDLARDPDSRGAQWDLDYVQRGIARLDERAAAINDAAHDAIKRAVAGDTEPLAAAHARYICATASIQDIRTREVEGEIVDSFNALLPANPRRMPMINLLAFVWSRDYHDRGLEVGLATYLREGARITGLSVFALIEELAAGKDKTLHDLVTCLTRTAIKRAVKSATDLTEQTQ